MSRLTQKQQFWTSHIDQWQSTLLSQSEYCEQNQLKAKDFYRWKNRLTTMVKNDAEQTTDRGQFLPVEIQEIIKESFIIKTSGVTIEFDSNVEPQTVRQLMAAIGVAL